MLLQVLKDEVDTVLSRLHDVQVEVQDLQQQTDTSTLRLRSAESLTSSMSDERVRWGQGAVATATASTAAPATALLDAAALTHLGPLTHIQRTMLLREWKQALIECGLEGGAEIEQWSVAGSLGDDMEVRKWCLQVRHQTAHGSEPH